MCILIHDFTVQGLCGVTKIAVPKPVIQGRLNARVYSVNYDAVLGIVLVTDTLCGDMMSKKASTLQIIRYEYLIKVLKFDKQAKR